MHSIKPGRGPSLMGGIGGLVAAVFGVFWMITASSIGAPWPFALFGLAFVALALGGAAYNFYNAGARNRMSTFDITSDREESDPIAEALGHSKPPLPPSQSAHPRHIAGAFCPFCGNQVQPSFDYCPKCGKDI